MACGKNEDKSRIVTTAYAEDVNCFDQDWYETESNSRIYEVNLYRSNASLYDTILRWNDTYNNPPHVAIFPDCGGITHNKLPPHLALIRNCVGTTHKSFHRIWPYSRIAVERCITNLHRIWSYFEIVLDPRIKTSTAFDYNQKLRWNAA